jgi:hypothetical protein
MEFEIAPGSSRSLLPGSLRFRLGTVNYDDGAGGGTLRRLDTNEAAGTVDYSTKTVRLTNWTGAGSTVTIQSAVLIRGQWSSTEMTFALAADPVAPGSVQIAAAAEDGTALSIADAGDGSIPAPHSGIIHHDSGLVAVTFDRPVWSGTVRYNAVAYTIVPLNPDVIGIDPTRLPPDGRVPIYKDGDLALLFEDLTQSVTLTPGASVILNDGPLGFVTLEDSAGEQVETLAALTGPNTSAALTRNDRAGPLEYAVLEDAKLRAVNGELYSADLDNWTVSIGATASLAGYELPLRCRFLPLIHPDQYSPRLNDGAVDLGADLDATGYGATALARFRRQQVMTIADVTPTGLISFQTPTVQAFGAGAKLAGILYHGNLQARYANLFAQHTWSATWSDALVGNAPTTGARYDDVAYPVQCSNIGTVRGRWRLRKRSDGQFDVVSEDMGVIAVWNGTSTLEARRLPSQAHPYFTLYHEGLGQLASWPTDSFIQFETYAAQGPYYLARVVRPGAASVVTDRYQVRHRTGAD